MKRLCILLAFLMMAASGVAHPDNVGPGTEFCDGQAAVAKGDGSASQVPIHIRVFSKAFAAACAKEAGLVTYLGTGTAQGLAGMITRKLPFAGSDVPLSTSDWLLVQKSAYNWASPVHQVPLYVDGWGVAYNIPCSGPTLRFRSSVLSLIYNGVITRWNDRLLVLDNAWLSTCNQLIRLARRVDDSAATDAFLDYLAKRNPSWQPYRRKITPQRWPTSNFACSGLGDAGMINCIASFRGSIGYVGMGAAAAAKMRVGVVENIAGTFVSPSASGCTAAASSAVAPPGTPRSEGLPWQPATTGDWSTVSITDAPNTLDGTPSYPICSFGYVIVLQNWLQGYAASVSTSVTRTVVDYFRVALSPAAQSLLVTNGYARLPESIRSLAEDGIRAVSFYRYTTGPI